MSRMFERNKCSSICMQFTAVGKSELIIPTNARSSGDDRPQKMEDIEMKKKVIREAEAVGMGVRKNKSLPISRER